MRGKIVQFQFGENLSSYECHFSEALANTNDLTEPAYTFQVTASQESKFRSQYMSRKNEATENRTPITRLRI